MAKIINVLSLSAGTLIFAIFISIGIRNNVATTYLNNCGSSCDPFRYCYYNNDAHRDSYLVTTNITLTYRNNCKSSERWYSYCDYINHTYSGRTRNVTPPCLNNCGSSDDFFGYCYYINHAIERSLTTTYLNNCGSSTGWYRYCHNFNRTESDSVRTTVSTTYPNNCTVTYDWTAYLHYINNTHSKTCWLPQWFGMFPRCSYTCTEWWPASCYNTLEQEKNEPHKSCTPGSIGPFLDIGEAITTSATDEAITTPATGEAITTPATVKYCDEEVDEIYSIRWGPAEAGKVISHQCPGNAIGDCKRKCSLNSDATASWSQPNCNSCFDKQFKTLLEQVDRLDQLNTTEIKNQTVVAKIASSLSAFTNRSDGLTAGNLNASVIVINRLAVFRNNNSNINPNEEEIKSIVQAISNILQPNNSEAWTQLQAVNSTVASAILFSADIYGQSLSKIHKSNYSYEKAAFVFLEAWSLEKSGLPHKLEFPTHSFSGENSRDRISLSVETLKNSISAGSDLNIWGLYYRTINDYLPGKKDTDSINSRVLSLSIGGLQTNEKLAEPVVITLEHNQAGSITYQRTCAFWNFDSGEWDSTGCSVTSTNFTHTVCSCDHLTNFAILMSRYPSYNKALSVLSIIGCSISVIALILTVIVYAVTWKQAKSAQATVLLNLCVALIIAYIIFMAGADKVDYKVGCKAVAILLHYFFLAAFFIMLVEGVELVIYIIFVFHVRRSFETILLVATAWVLPLIIVVISVGSRKAEGYGDNNQACWLSVNNGLIWAFIAPVLCIVTVNFVILAIVLIWMNKARSFMAKNEKRNEIRATIWNLSVTCPVLGLGWLFGVLSVAFNSVLFQYLFVIANSAQGLLIFIFHALFHNKKMSEKISYVYANYICRCRIPDSSQPTSSRDPPEAPPKLGFVARTVKHYEELGAQDTSTGTQPTSNTDCSTL